MTEHRQGFNNLNDPRDDYRWTAYVLGEMDAAARSAFEKEIEEIPEKDVILEEIRETIGLVGEAVPSDLLALTSAQRARIGSAVPASPQRTMGFWAWSAAAGVAAVALAGFIAITTPGLVTEESPADAAEVRSTDGGEPASARAETDAPESSASVARGERREAMDDTDANTAIPVAAPEERQSIALSGSVMDRTGGVLPGADVTLVEKSTQNEATTITDNAGSFRFNDVPEGEVPGLETAVLDNVEIQDDARLDVELDVAPTAASVDVAVAADELLRQSSSSVAEGAGVVGGQVSGIARSFVQANGAARAVAAPPPPPPPPAPPAPPTVGEGFRRSPDQRAAQFNTEEYGRINDNPFQMVADEPLATFSADVDTASYANVRRFLTQRTMPPPDAVRIEEMVNYFTYNYEVPNGGAPVRVNAEVAAAPWNTDHRLVRIGIQGERIDWEERAPTNLVFLIDVSGSMNSPDKLPLLREGMKLLVEQLGENDRVAIVVYAGNSGLVLPPTLGDRRQQIIRALDRLQAGGSTNGGAGIQLAYDTAVANFIEGGVNRVILATDGDFNVGVTNNGDLTRLIEEKAESGVFLSVLGFGTGNLNDAGMEALANRGNGNYGYLDSIREARKVLVEQMGGTLITIAKDVKFQVEFNPAEVSAYRLIGYENRVLENQDFNDDAIDAGEIGAGHTVTALFEVVPAGVELDVPGVDDLRYQTAPATTDIARSSGELLTVKVRYKEPDEDTSLLIDTPVQDAGRSFDEATGDFRFASSVAAFGMLLRNSPYSGDATFDMVLDIADDSRGADPEGYRDEFVDLVRRARAIRDLGGR